MACIKRTKTGLWQVDFRLKKKRIRSSFSTRAEAQEFIRELKLRPIDTMLCFQRPIERTVASAVHDYIQGPGALKSERSQKLEHLVFRMFRARFSDRTLKEIHLFDLETWRTELKCYLENESINRYFNSIGHFFKKCVEWGYVVESPMRHLNPLKSNNLKARKALLTAESQRLVENAKPWLRDIIEFALQSGLRRSELVHLKWNSVDFDLNVVHVESSEGFHPKSYRPRTLPLTKGMREILLRRYRCAGQLTKNSEDNVFLNSLNESIRPDELTKAMARLNRKVGFKGLGMHKLRHTFCSKLASKGAGAQIIKSFAGHADIRTTQRYVHLTVEDLRQSLKNIEI